VNGDEGMKIIVVYVDDLILMVRSLGKIQQMKEGLSETFKIKDMGHCVKSST